MITWESVRQSILDWDGGSSRDITLGEDISQENAEALLLFFNEIYGDNIPFLFEEGMIHSVFSNSQFFITDIQLFMTEEKNSKYFAEITFFPESIQQEKLRSEKFYSFLKKIIEITETKELYLRYESMGWDFGTIDGTIILTHNELNKK